MQETNTGQFCGFESHSQHSFRHPVQIENDIMTSYGEKDRPPSYEIAVGPGQHGGHPGYGQPGYGQPAGYGQPGPQYGYSANTVVVQQPGHVRPSDWLILSIVSVFFCWPVAICAIVYSCNSKSSADAGDYSRAESEGRNAKKIGIAAIVLGLIMVMAIAVPFALTASVSASIDAVCRRWDCYH